MVQTMLTMIVCFCIGKMVFRLLIDGLFQMKIPHLVIGFLMKMNVPYGEADRLYGEIFMKHKDIYQWVGFALLFLVSYYVMLSRTTGYFENIGKGVENILIDAQEPIELPGELQSIAEKLNTLKMTLRRRNKMAQDSEQRKNDLVVYLAHDLKTPLTSVIAYLSMLEEKPDMAEEERAKYVHISLGKAVRLGELIDEFFEITRYNLQDIHLEKETINISMMLEQIADEFYAVFAEHGLTGSVDAAEDLMTEGDPDKLARVFDNLLRNAVAYSYRGTAIGIQAYSEGQNVVIVFSNQGEIIPKQKLQSIFEKFYRMDSARSSHTGGAGLGLSVAKEIVELHGGTIEAFSDAQSTRFVVRLRGITDGQCDPAGAGQSKWRKL